MAEKVSRNKRWFFTALIVLVLAALAYMQFRTWRKFDWAVFFAQIHAVRLSRVIAGVSIIWGGYILRSMRWSIMLRPTKEVPWSRLMAAQFIGFTGLAISAAPANSSGLISLPGRNVSASLHRWAYGWWSASLTWDATSCWWPAIWYSPQTIEEPSLLQRISARWIHPVRHHRSHCRRRLLHLAQWRWHRSMG